MTMADYGPSITACKLWEKTSAKGLKYMAGRIGGIRVTVMPNRDRQSEDDPSHVLLFSEAPSRNEG